MKLLLALLLACTLAAAGDVDRALLEKHVRALASEEFQGRLGPGARKAETYVADAFRAAGLTVRIEETKALGNMPCRNVIGIRQAGKEPAPEHAIVSAHYDHLGYRNGKLHPGAGDNAAGVATLLELARVLEPPPGRDLLFIAFDLEEWGLWGSRRYCQAPVRPLAECAFFLTMDILGRDLVDATEGILFCVGLERSEGLFETLVRVQPGEGLKPAYAGADIVGDRSDFAGFRDREVPFVFFSAGEFGDYHLPSDTADRLDFAKLGREADYISAATRAMLAAPRPRFAKDPVSRVEEAASMELIVGQLLAKKEALGMSDMEAQMGGLFRKFLQGVVKSGKMEPAQRQQLVGTCAMLMQTLQSNR
ncbi:MAG: M28 family metallopeptidase [Planctomycetaceae bacterium]